jgi:chemotaxis signal transduction protein
MSASDTATARFDPAAQAAAPRIAFRPHRALPWLLLPEGMPLQVLIETAPVRVPNTRPWFKGVVSQRGNLLPVFDLSAWAGLADEDDGRLQVVAIGLGTQACAMLCATAPTLLRVDAEDETSTEDSALSPFLGRGYTSALGRACEFDIQRWLATAAQQISGNTAA